MTSTIARTPVVRGPHIERAEDILTPDALAFVAALDGAFAGRRAELLAQRRARAKRISAGETPGFLGTSRSVRADTTWQVAPPAPGLVDRRVEITGPPTRRMTVNALNSGANVWMADFEDALSPTWDNIVTGQLNLRDALRLDLGFEEDGKQYTIGETTPTVRADHHQIGPLLPHDILDHARRIAGPNRARDRHPLRRVSLHDFVQPLT